MCPVAVVTWKSDNCFLKVCGRGVYNHMTTACMLTLSYLVMIFHYMLYVYTAHNFCIHT